MQNGFRNQFAWHRLCKPSGADAVTPCFTFLQMAIDKTDAFCNDRAVCTRDSSARSRLRGLSMWPARLLLRLCRCQIVCAGYWLARASSRGEDRTRGAGRADYRRFHADAPGDWREWMRDAFQALSQTQSLSTCGPVRFSHSHLCFPPQSSFQTFVLILVQL